jgi:hypothetical protein
MVPPMWSGARWWSRLVVVVAVLERLLPLWTQPVDARDDLGLLSQLGAARLA